MNGFSKDVQYALRSMRKSPGFTAAAVVSLALTLINAVFLQPLPVEDAGRLITIYISDPRNPGFLPLSCPNFQDYRDQSDAFSGGGSAGALGRTVNLNGHPFTVIGVGPANFNGTNALNGPALWAPLAMHAQLLPFEALFNSRRFLWMNVLGRNLLFGIPAHDHVPRDRGNSGGRRHAHRSHYGLAC